MQTHVAWNIESAITVTCPLLYVEVQQSNFSPVYERDHRIFASSLENFLCSIKKPVLKSVWEPFEISPFLGGLDLSPISLDYNIHILDVD
jgi:hypothetical protein